VHPQVFSGGGYGRAHDGGSVSVPESVRGTFAQGARETGVT
jgi:hypothetical protein